MILEIRTLGDPVLRERCPEVGEVDGEVGGLMDDMIETIEAHPNHVGLAASQVGALKKAFVYDVGHGGRCVINPEIVHSEGESTMEEGCLSLPGIAVRVPRADRIKMRCRTRKGHQIMIEASDFVARIFQHERDHLDGVLIIDRCDKEERRLALAEYQEIELERKQAG